MPKGSAAQPYDSQWTDELILNKNFHRRKNYCDRKKSKKKSETLDYLLRYSQNFPIAIVEAKKKYKSAADGLQQAKEYAQILGLKFAYSTNGTEIIEFDFITDWKQNHSFPTPTELGTLNHEPIKPEIKRFKTILC